MISMLSRRPFAGMLVAASAITLVGCSQRVQTVTMKDAADLAAEALVTTIVGRPLDQRATVMGKAEPPLLQPGVYENILVTTDYDSFVKIAKGAISPKEIQGVEKEAVRLCADYFKHQDYTKAYTISAAPYPVNPSSVPDKTLVATFTPQTEEGGSPQDRSRGKGKTYIVFRLTVTNPATGTVLRVREFYSGRDAGVKY